MRGPLYSPKQFSFSPWSRPRRKLNQGEAPQEGYIFVMVAMITRSRTCPSHGSQRGSAGGQPPIMRLDSTANITHYSVAPHPLSHSGVLSEICRYPAQMEPVCAATVYVETVPKFRRSMPNSCRVFGSMLLTGLRSTDGCIAGAFRSAADRRDSTNPRVRTQADQCGSGRTGLSTWAARWFCC